MRLNRVFLLACMALLVVPIGAFSDEVAQGGEVYTAQTAFDSMKQLEGTWSGESLVVPVGKELEDGVQSDTSVTYRLIANGSSIVATYGEGTPTEMVSLYHMDGPEALVHTHYCAVGNQPTMRFSKSSEPRVIRFDFSKGSNMDVHKDGHVHAGIIRIVDEDTIESETELWKNGKLAAIRHAKLARQK